MASAEAPRPEVRPQPGPQELILRTPADIGIIGGSVFGGKTWALVMEPLRHIGVPGFTFVGFRREMPDATNPGGIWDETTKWYPSTGAVERSHVHEWEWPSGAKGKIASLPSERDLEGWKSAQICLLLFDQLETFTGRMFWWMLSRNRSTCGVQPYVRASVNPDPDSFLVDVLAWWLDANGEYADPAKSGTIRWFVRDGDALRWSAVTCPPDDYDRYEARRLAAIADLEAQGVAPDDAKFALSLTFVLARLQDNRIGNDIDPQYEGKVRAMAKVDRERLLGGDKGGNWKIRPTAGLVFDSAWFQLVDALPAPSEVDAVVRYWDKAGTEGAGKWSVGLLLLRSRGLFVVADIVRGQWSAGNRENQIKQTADLDTATWGGKLETWVEQEPGSGGKESAESTVRNLAGHTIRVERVTGDKVTRAKPLSAQAEARNLRVLTSPWAKDFLAELHRFDGTGVCDQVDAASGAFNKLTLGRDGYADYLHALMEKRRAAEAARTGQG